MVDTNKITGKTIATAIRSLVEYYEYFCVEEYEVTFSSMGNAAELALACAGACESPYSQIYVTLGRRHGIFTLEHHNCDTREGVASVVKSALWLAEDYFDDTFELWVFVPGFDSHTREWSYVFEQVPLH